MSQFKVGDVVEVIDSHRWDRVPEVRKAKWIGRTGEIVAPFSYPFPCWVVRLDIGDKPFFAESLRLKNQPSDDTHIPAEDEFTDWLKSQLRVKA